MDSGEWKYFYFNEIATLSKEKFNPRSNGAMRCIELEHINQGTGQINGWTSSKEQKSIKNIFRTGDILFGKLRPYLKKYWHANFDGVCSSEIWVLKPNKKIILNQYLFYFIQLNEFISVANISSGSKMPRADWNFIINFPFSIPLPPLPEQKKIAEILSTWDKAIQIKELLIKELNLRKKALMQRLLTGKVRFKEFEGQEWKEVRLGDVLYYEQPTNYLVNSTEYNDKYEIPVLTAGKTFILGYTNETEGVYKNNLPVIIFDDFTTSNNFVTFPFKVKSSAMKFLIPKNNKVNIKYIYESMQLIKFEVGDDHKRFWISEYQFIKIKLPNLEEQRKIASVLTAQDKQIDLLKQQKTALEQQKKGLMQVLLTGTIRVKMNDEGKVN